MKDPVSRRMFLAAAGAGLVSSRFSRAQEPAAGSDAKFSTDVKVVNVLASVRDKQGRIVSDLTKDDFDLQDEGRHQTITYFSRETEMPLTLGLLVDTSGSQRRVIGEETDASRRFVEKVVREDRDQTFLIHFDRDTELLQDLTNSRSKLERALDQVGLDDTSRGGGGGYGGGVYGGGGGSRRGGGGAGGGTTLYDAVYLASNEIMKKRMGRKAVILLTDGVDHGSKESLPQAIESAQRSDTLVYSILFTGQEQQQSPFGGGGFGGRGMSRRGGGFPQQTYERTDGKRVLQQMSRETGGGFYEVSKNMSIDQIYARIEEELRNQYSLGYSPDSAGYNNFRHITVAVRRSNMVVQARQGYYPAN